eukprot:6447377-Pyramimonas_sp.AAC.1
MTASGVAWLLEAPVRPPRSISISSMSCVVVVSDSPLPVHPPRNLGPVVLLLLEQSLKLRVLVRLIAPPARSMAGSCVP